MRTCSELLADYIARLSFKDIPTEVSEKAKHLFLDTLGVMILGSDKPWTLILLDYLKELGEKPEADAVYHGIQLPAANAAFINGTMAHSFDYDDDLAACHIAACVIPAAIAVGQKIHASGEEVIASIVLGYEINVRLAETLDGHHLFAMGYHPTSVCGAYGALAAAAKLLRLSEEQIMRAMGIAGSFLSGNTEWLADGSMTKRMHAGKAAHEGITASLLAQRGFTGPRSIFEGRNGIFKIFQAQREPERFTQDLFQTFYIMKSFMKWYPCCTCSAPLLDGIVELRRESSLRIDDIEEVEARVRKVCFSLIGDPLEEKQHPQTILEAQMSAPYCVAVALLDGEVTPLQFTLERLKDPNVLKLATKVKVVWNPDLDVPGDPRPIPTEVIIRLSNQQVLNKRIDCQKGSYRNPLTFHELERKFCSCVAGKLPEEKKKKIVEMVKDLEKIEDINHIVRMMKGSPAGGKP